MNRKSGMTLVEIMIVIAILSILALIATAYLRSQVFKSYDSRKKAEIKRISIAIEEYEKDNDCYPLSNVVVCTNEGSNLMPYLSKIPCDPISKASYFYEHEDSMCPRWYRIYSSLQNESDVDYQIGIGPNAAFNYEYSSPNAPAVTQVIPVASNAPSSTSSSVPMVDFYGCVSGACVQINWNSSRPGPECDPNFQNNLCYGQCSSPGNECQIWGN